MINVDNIVLVVDGGIGKNIVSTVIIRNIAKKYPNKRLIVIAGYPDIFLNNPHIYRVFKFNNPLYFYEDYIKNSKSHVIKIEPYYHADYLYKKRHLADVWCEMAGVPCDNITPELYFLENEKKMAQLFIEKNKDKKIILLQCTGGINPDENTKEKQIASKASMYRRNLSIKTGKIITKQLNAKGYKVFSVQLPNQPKIEGTEICNFPIRSIMGLLPYVKGVICIDSFLQHAAAAVGKKALVLWGGTHPTCLGYPSNINLTREVCDNPFCHRPNSYMFDIQPHGFMWDCPHGDKCMDYNPNRIITALTGQKQYNIIKDKKNVKN